MDIIKAVLFDLDDTLLNSKKAQHLAVVDFKNLYKCFESTDDDEFSRYWNSITEKAYDEYLKKKISFQDMRIKRMQMLFSTYLEKISKEEADNRFKEYLKAYERNWVLFDDAKEVLESLKKRYKLAIVSNGDSDQQRKKIEVTGLDKYFSDIVISGEVGFSKPEKEIFEIACKMLNVNKKNAVMIGDKYKVDIEGSINAGMNGIWVNRKLENQNYKYQIKELKELEKYLQINKER